MKLRSSLRNSSPPYWYITDASDSGIPWMPSHKLIMLDSKEVWPRPQSCMIAVDGIGAVHAPFSPMAAPTALIASGTGTGLGVIVPNESDPRLRLMGTCVLGTIWV